MKIISCCKIVPDEELIQVAAGGSLDFTQSVPKIGQYDLNAIESGKQLAQATGGTLTALSLGNSKMLGESKIRKDVLSRGADDLKLVINDECSFEDSLQTSKALADAIKQCGDFDLVLCGMGSSDLYSQVVGIQVGTLLGLPVTNSVTGIEIIDDHTLKIERLLEDESVLMEISLPAVLCLSSEINVPPVPSMREIMKAGKKPVTELSPANFDAGTNIVDQLAPEQKTRRGEIIEGDGEDAVNALLQFLKKECL